MACRGCVVVTVDYARLDLVVQQAADPGPACVTSTPLTAIVYGNALDMRVTTCVRGDTTFYLSEPIGEIVLGDDILG